LVRVQTGRERIATQRNTAPTGVARSKYRMKRATDPAIEDEILLSVRVSVIVAMSKASAFVIVRPDAKPL